jgi:hypothetical protein
MNNAASKVMTAQATVWDITGTDQYGGATYSSPYLIKCNYIEGGKLNRDDRGEEFMPMATFRSFNATPKKGSVIAIGDHTSSNPTAANAQTIRKVVTKTPFRNWAQRYTFLTG